MAARLGEREQQRLQALGLTPLTPERALQALDQLLARHLSGSVAVLEADWDRLARQARGPQATLLAPLAAAQQAAHTHGGAPGPAGTPPPYRAVLAATPELERHGVLVQFLQQQLATVMGMADAAQIDPSEPLFALGLDSLMALELMVLLENNLGVRLTESLVFEHPTVEDLARYFLAEVLVDASPKEPSATAPAMPDTAPPDPAAPTTTTTPAEPGRWEQEVASVAALDTASLLRQLRGS
jgi:acyl carrier protein